jgi:CRISPR-associated endonuclease/helicase Cas3
VYDIELVAEQRSIGNRTERVLGKSGSARPMEGGGYRHELGSVIDAKRSGLLAALPLEEQDLALHLVAAHHGRARPHFPNAELFDPEAHGVDLGAMGVEIVERFARLQQRYGRWGLAYLESLVRAADYAATIEPSSVVEDLP